MNSPRILLEDNHLLVVAKQPLQLSQSDQSGEPSLHDTLKQWLKQKYNKPGEVYLGLVHRLDRSVSGVMVFAKTSKAAARLSEQIRERKIKKTYRAWVEGAVAKGAPLQHWLSYDDGYVRVHTQEGKGRQLARLRYQPLRATASASLIEIDLESGRKHQIRAQLSAHGHPILGDERYGSRTRWQAAGIALVAHRLELEHPTLKSKVEVTLPSEWDPVSSAYGG